MEPVEQVLAAFEPKKSHETRKERPIPTHCGKFLGLVDHQSTETGLKPRLQVQHILGRRLLLEPQTNEILVVIAVSGPEHRQMKNREANRRPWSTVSSLARVHRQREQAIVAWFFPPPLKCGSTLANISLSQDKTHF